MAAWKSSSTAMKAETLPLPCPFCGSTNLDIEHTADCNQRVVCKECRAQGPDTYHQGIEVVTARWNDREDGDAVRVLREMSHDMDLLLERNAALKWETQWLAEGIRRQDEEHAGEVEQFAARVTELIIERDRYKARADEKRALRVELEQALGIESLPPTAADESLRRGLETIKALKNDRERLDWLDAVNRNTNERIGTTYGWKYDINHNRAALTDCNLPALSIRAAIDAAMKTE